MEILNLDYHRCRLLLKALNKFEYEMEAADALGISDHTLYNYKKEFLVLHDYVDGKKVWVTRSDVLNKEKYLKQKP